MVPTGRVLVTFLSVVFAAVLAPGKTHSDVRFFHVQEFEPLRVAISKSSPARGALMDAQLVNTVIPTIKRETIKKSQPSLRVINLEEQTVSVHENIEAPEAPSLKVPVVVEPETLVWLNTVPGAVPSEIRTQREDTEVSFDDSGKTVVTFVAPVRVVGTGSTPSSPNKSEENPPPKAGLPAFKDLLAGARKTDPGGAVAAASMASSDPAKITGLLELRGGLGFTGGSRELSIFRINHGRSEEVASINYQSGTFEIDVAQMSGTLRGELRTGDGKLIGSGEVWLPDASRAKLRLVIEPMEINVARFFRDIEGRPVPAARVGVTGAGLSFPADNGGRVKLGSFHKTSTFSTMAEKPGFWKTVSFSASPKSSALSLVSEERVKDLAAVAEPAFHMTWSEIQSGGIIYGAIRTSGETRAGATVELPRAGAAGPIYFNEEGKPDVSLTATSKNGRFAFIGASSGIFVVRGTVQGRRLPATMVGVDPGAVTWVNLETSTYRQVEISLADGVTKNPLKGTINFPGQDEGSFIRSGGLLARVSETADPLFLETYPMGNYPAFLYSGDRTSHIVHIPMYRNEWIDSIAIENRLNPMPERGTLVAAVDGGKYQVFLDESDSESQIFYFDGDGRTVDGPVEDGGFIIFNVPGGMRALTLVPAQGAPLSKIFAVDPAFVSVIRHSL